MARLVWVALVCWPTPLCMYMLTGRWAASRRAASLAFAAATPVMAAEFSARCARELGQCRERGPAGNCLSAAETHGARAEKRRAHRRVIESAAGRIVDHRRIADLVPGDEPL